jgi:hypothetical protein
MCVRWLPATTESGDPFGKARPRRPDIPILRNFSFEKWHSIQLGVLFGLFVAGSLEVGQSGVAVGAVLLVVRAAVGEHNDCEHDIGFHDVREKPHYFGTAFLAVLVPWFVLF